MTTKTLYIVRHGETEQNKKGIVQGRGVDSVLNETGIKQAEFFYQHYKEYNFDQLFCSTQQRSYQTIQGFDPFGMSIIRDSRLDEINWGEHEGKAGNPELMDKYYRIIHSWSNGNYHDAALGGESAFELSQRLKSFLGDLNGMDFSKALICTHGRTIRALICLLKQQDLKHMEVVQHRNTGLYVAEWQVNQWNVILENDSKHLDKLI